ncbi:hypothetical protein BGX38DRAFT_454693 [Terfezia claveryi]|nr:hypothetical protein BGX38DRAFT_454693 [Terfezia claveryi]
MGSRALPTGLSEEYCSAGGVHQSLEKLQQKPHVYSQAANQLYAGTESSPRVIISMLLASIRWACEFKCSRGRIKNSSAILTRATWFPPSISPLPRDLVPPLHHPPPSSLHPHPPLRPPPALHPRPARHPRSRLVFAAAPLLAYLPSPPPPPCDIRIALPRQHPDGSPQQTAHHKNQQLQHSNRRLPSAFLRPESATHGFVTAI